MATPNQNPAVSGHNTVIAVATDDTTFNEIAQLKGRVEEGEISRESKDVTPHKDTVQSFIFSPVMHHGELSFAGNYIQANSTHGVSAGLRGWAYNGTVVALEFQGPNWVARTTDSKIMSGVFTSFMAGAGEKANEYDFAVKFQPQGVFEYNGTQYGSVAA